MEKILLILITSLSAFTYANGDACSQPQDQGSVCHVGYKLVWFYDASVNQCSQFWYGGCGGNDNRFPTKEMCETVCVL